MRVRTQALVLIWVLIVGACGGPGTVSPQITKGGSAASGVLPVAVPVVEEVSLTGLVNAELALRQELRAWSGVASILDGASAGFSERFDTDLAEYGRVALAGLAEDAGIGPLAGSGLTVAVGGMGPPTAEWGGSLQAVSGNFTLSIFMGMVAREWQRLSGSEWSVEGELPPDVHDQVVDGVAEHSEMRTTVNGSASGDELHFEIHVVSKATLTSVSTGEVVATYEATGRGVVEAKGCPDPEGLAEGHYTLELEEKASGAGGASAGGSSQIDGPFKVLNGDDARLIKTDFEGRFDSAGSGAGPSGEPVSWSVQSTFPISIPAGGGLEVDDSRATYQESNAPADRGPRATASLMTMAAHYLSGVAQEAEKFWRSGKCVDLTSSEESRKVSPSEQVSIDVTATHHFDSDEIEAPIIAYFSGTDTIDPVSGTPVDPPASFTYIAGSEPGDKGTINLEQKSRRGIGKKALEFEVEPQDLLLSLDGRYQLAGDGFDLDFQFVITDVPLVRGDDGVFRGSGTGTVVGGGAIGCSTAAVQPTVSFRAEGRVNPTDPEVIRIVFPLDSITGEATQTCPGISVNVPVAAAVGPLLAAAGQAEIRIGQSTSFQSSIPGGAISGIVKVVRDS